MTRFDAPKASSRSGDLRKTIAALLVGSPGVVLGALFVTLLVLLLATTLVGLTIAVPTALRHAFTASPILVFASPTATRSDVEALGTALKGLPMVSDATLRPKDVALSALIQAGLPAAADGRNPLPDVWMVRLRLDGPRPGDPDFVSLAVGARDAIASLPAVDRVRFEDGWVTQLDRWESAWSKFGLPTIAVALCAGAVGLVCLYGIFSRALKWPVHLENQHKQLALAIVELLVFSVCGVLVYAAGKFATDVSGASDSPLLKPIADQLGLSLAAGVASIVAVGLVAAWMGSRLFGIRE